MRLASPLTSLSIGIIVGICMAFSAMPLWKFGLMQVGQNHFGDLTFKCDDAMRGHLMAKQKLVGTPSKANADALKSAEIGLLDCQDYDLMRKRLTRWGLTDNELSEMSLVAIEEKGADLRDVVRIHEIRY
jgi:BarA-like signal transduction histidine kinase